MIELIERALKRLVFVDLRPKQGGRKFVPFVDEQEKADLHRIWCGRWGNAGDSDA